MEFRIADTFTDSLARLTGDEQKATTQRGQIYFSLALESRASTTAIKNSLTRELLDLKDESF